MSQKEGKRDGAPVPGPLYWKALANAGPQTIWVRASPAWRKTDLTKNRQQRPGINAGERHGMAKLTDADIPVLFRRYEHGETTVTIARDYGVSPRTVTEAVAGRRWKHIPGAPGIRSRKGRAPRGPAHPNAKFTANQIRAVEALALRQVPAAEIARRFNVNECTIHAVLFGRSYAGSVVLRGHYPKPIRTDTAWNRKLTDQQVTEIRRRYADGELQTSIGASYGVSKSTIHEIVTGQSYRTVTP